MSYQSPIPPNEDRMCCDCVHNHYDSWHDESWCDKQHFTLLDGGGTCEHFESWREVERKKIKQLMLFNKTVFDGGKVEKWSTA